MTAPFKEKLGPRGRVDRANRTMQNHLFKEHRMVGVCDAESGNALLPDFVQRHNERFSTLSNQV
jgi:hypothetical protein